ncbi:MULTISPECIES: hypothetical protein [unclassified Mesorhizobium]|uniref:hypothetical protein n=1 Tax=unclassified Mesorhizobium TaxID=325217 RepID=UPI001671C2E8|nr:MULTISPECIES: hypothetical protein [unclassified Mesorhizobium]
METRPARVVHGQDIIRHRLRRRFVSYEAADFAFADHRRIHKTVEHVTRSAAQRLESSGMATYKQQQILSKRAKSSG